MINKSNIKTIIKCTEIPVEFFCLRLVQFKFKYYFVRIFLPIEVVTKGRDESY